MFGARACVPRVAMNNTFPSGADAATSRAAGTPLCPGRSSIETGLPSASASGLLISPAMRSEKLPGEKPSTSRTPCFIAP